MTTRTIATMNGDYALVCDVCAHYVVGFTPEDIGLTEWPEATVTGRALQPQSLRETKERTDSTLISVCDVCESPRERGQWFTVFQAMADDVTPAPVPYLKSDSAVNTTGTMPSADTLAGMVGHGLMRTPAYPYAQYARKAL